MAILLEIHSVLRWVILIVGLIAIVKFLIGWVTKREFGKMDRGLSAGFSGLIDLQVLLGLLYLLIDALGGAGFPLFRIEHTVTMLVAAFVAHAPAFFRKRPVNRYAISFVAVIGSLILIYIGIARLPGGWNR